MCVTAEPQWELLFIFKPFLIEIELMYIVSLVSSVQQCDSDRRMQT